jgi:hypothetical protein
MTSVGPDDGVDIGRAQGSDRDDRDPLLAGGQTDKGIILDELCATTGWHRNHARKALTTALQPKWYHREVRGHRSTGRMSLPH